MGMARIPHGIGGGANRPRRPDRSLAGAVACSPARVGVLSPYGAPSRAIVKRI